MPQVVSGYLSLCSQKQAIFPGKTDFVLCASVSIAVVTSSARQFCTLLELFLVSGVQCEQ